MSTYAIVDTLVTLGTLGIGAWGSWTLHARLRSAGSLLLMLSLALFIAYCLCSRLLSDLLLPIVESRAPSLAQEFAWGMGSLAPSLLCLGMSIGFLAAVRSLGR